jgi:hypothetical protein
MVSKLIIRQLTMTSAEEWSERTLGFLAHDVARLMFLVGRIIGKVDARLLIGTGLVVTAISLYEMSAFTPDVSQWAIVRTGFAQGLGFGLIFVPLSTVTFATPPPA